MIAGKKWLCFKRCQLAWFKTKEVKVRAVGVGRAGKAPTPDFGRTVNPIQTMRADYVHHITTGSTGPLDFQTFLWHRMCVGFDCTL